MVGLCLDHQSLKRRVEAAIQVTEKVVESAGMTSTIDTGYLGVEIHNKPGSADARVSANSIRGVMSLIKERDMSMNQRESLLAQQKAELHGQHETFWKKGLGNCKEMELWNECWIKAAYRHIKTVFNARSSSLKTSWRKTSGKPPQTILKRNFSKNASVAAFLISIIKEYISHAPKDTNFYNKEEPRRAPYRHNSLLRKRNASDTAISNLNTIRLGAHNKRDLITLVLDIRL